MGYTIACYAKINYGKTTIIKNLCIEIEKYSNLEIIFQYEDISKDGEDILRAYKLDGLLIFIISAGDNPQVVVDGYSKLKKGCDGLNCDLLVCAVSQNPQRQTGQIREIEQAVMNISRTNGHWLEKLYLSKYQDKNKERGEGELAEINGRFNEFLLNLQTKI